MCEINKKMGGLRANYRRKLPQRPVKTEAFIDANT